MKTKIMIGILLVIFIIGYVMYTREAASSSNSPESSPSVSPQETITPEIARQSQINLWIDVTEYGVRVSIPDNWANNITLRKFANNGDGPATYGFLLSPKDMQVIEQYVGALRVYDESDWNRLDEESKNEEIELSVLNGKVYVYRNSLFNQYQDLPQTELFDALVLADEEVQKYIHIEKILGNS